MGYDMREGTVVRWLKAEGDEVKVGEPIAEIETDKAVVEFESTATGVLIKLLVSEGSSVPVGQPIGIVGVADEETPKTGGDVDEVSAEAEAETETAPPPSEHVQPPPVPEAPPAEAQAVNAGEVRASPVARRIAEERRIDLSQVTGTGPGGRITRDDVLSFEPPAAEVVEEPAAAEVTEEPPTAEVVEEPAAAEVVEESAAAEVVEEPAAAEVVEEAPAAEVTEEPPTAEVVEEPPVAEVVEEAPAAEVVEEAPAAEVVEESPAAEVTEESPAAEVTEEEPAAAEVVEEPAAAEVVEEPAAAEVTEEEPAAEVVEESAAAEVVEESAAAEVVEESAAAEVTEEEPPASEAPEAPSGAETVVLTRMRQQIARVTVKSKTEIPHFYVSADIDMTEAMGLRAQINERMESEGIKISVNDLVVMACASALKKHPKFNSYFLDDAIQVQDRINIGIAIAEEDGLIIPAVMDCARKSLSEIAGAGKELINRAKTGTLRPEEYTGGTFTVSNLGMYDVASFTAIIHPPQAAVLAVGKVAKRPVVRGDDIAIAQVMTATLSADHRVADGAEGADLLIEIKKALENPFSFLV